MRCVGCNKETTITKSLETITIMVYCCFDCAKKILGKQSFFNFSNRSKMEFYEALEEMEDILNKQFLVLYPAWRLRVALEAELAYNGAILDDSSGKFKVIGGVDTLTKIEELKQKYYGRDLIASIDAYFAKQTMLAKEMGEQLRALNNKVSFWKLYEVVFDNSFDIVIKVLEDLLRDEKIEINHLLQNKEAIIWNINDSFSTYQFALNSLYKKFSVVANDEVIAHIMHAILGALSGTTFGLFNHICGNKSK